MNRLVRVLQGQPQRAETERDTGYLPPASHPRFDQLCADWTAILSRDMPIYDALKHLIASAGLNLLLYFLERGKEQTGDTESVEITCEIVSRERTKVRALSGESYQANQALSVRAVRSAVEGVRLMPEWAAALASEDPSGGSRELDALAVPVAPGGAGSRRSRVLTDVWRRNWSSGSRRKPSLDTRSTSGRFTWPGPGRSV